MVKVRITARNFTHGAKIYGTNGEYPVDEKTARYIVANGKGYVIEGELPAEDGPTSSVDDASFLNLLSRNADKVLDILETAAKNRRDAELDDELQEEETSQASGAQTTNDNSEGGTKNEDSVNSGADQSGNAMETSNVDTDLPEDFPGRDVLIKAGITKVSQIPSEKDSLMAVEGMTARLANQIGIKTSKS